LLTSALRGVSYQQHATTSLPARKEDLWIKVMWAK